ncbi:fructose-specific PTS transporter subunit EIIC [Sporolactobacillus shoreicorticis]|uniref:Fructose-specific PTS transporter subunit EIIC n=1 Tax=Sporolactobacillus shoreicorticis TaxID=1923877 RepID=A0ABW5SA62_9BACL|nr:fructose-specific PTS transporter subunit EIIC [Sporolactobacillus shoreicorticis]MCO7125505.1 fructose-specific PTS transporter subunit EIIC [Sporolactobacillus shoreicorticis]
MKVTDLLTAATVNLDLKSTTKKDVMDELAATLDKAGKLNDLAEYRAALDKREEQSTTGIGDGVAIPHSKTAAVKEAAIAFGRSKEGVDFQSLDGQPAHLFFMIAATDGANATHLEALSTLSTFLIDAAFREKLMNAATADEIVALFDEQESESENVAAEEKKAAENNTDGYEVLAVTGCPTGIAHTYMAADALKQKAKEMGVSIKVQTNGSTGIKNRLQADEIEKAKGIIVAASINIDVEPFKGKPLVQVPVTDGIRRPEELINEVIEGKAPVYQGDGSAPKAAAEEEPKGKKINIYKNLMNGVTYMLPFVVGGGILIAISYLIASLTGVELKPVAGVVDVHDFPSLLSFIGNGNAMYLMIPILAGFIAMSIADRPGLAPGMVGGLMALTSNAGFLGGLIAGFLAGYVVELVKWAFQKWPQSLDGLKPVLIYPVFGIFITGALMFLINQPISDFMEWMTHLLNSMGTGNLVLLGLILGGMMGIDLGGPFNKIAFTFGIAMISAGNFYPQAAVMAGGMVPPLGMALATTLFAHKFNRAQRDSGKVAYVLGAAFISEGAIPFGAADPIRVMVSTTIGSALAGGLSLLFGIGLRPPHGGIFVIPLVSNGNPFLYAFAIIIGTVVTAIIYGIWKKPLKEQENA